MPLKFLASFTAHRIGLSIRLDPSISSDKVRGTGEGDIQTIQHRLWGPDATWLHEDCRWMNCDLFKGENH